VIFEKDKRIRIISGHYGVGKSEFAANYAIKLSKYKNRRKKITIVDLDIVNPYFTTRGISNILKKNNIEIIGPSYEATNADLPALPREIDSVFFDEDYDVIIDLGGDAAGSKVIGRYSNHIKNQGYDFFYLININRPFSEDFDGVYQFLLDIQNASRLNVTHIVNSTHLLFQTTIEEIKKGDSISQQISEKLSIPYRYVVVPDWLISFSNEQKKEPKNELKNELKNEQIDENDENLLKLKKIFKAEDIFNIDLTLRPVWLGDEGNY